MGSGAFGDGTGVVLCNMEWYLVVDNRSTL